MCCLNFATLGTTSSQTRSLNEMCLRRQKEAKSGNSMSFKRNESRTFYASVSSVNLKQKSRKITEKFILQHHNLHLKIGRNSSHSKDIFLQFKGEIQDSSLNFTFSVKNKESFLRHRALMTLKTSFALKRTS